MGKVKYFEHKYPFLQVVNRNCLCRVGNATYKTGGLCFVCFKRQNPAI